MAKRRVNRTDLTLRNLHAAHARLARVEAALKQLRKAAKLLAKI